MLQYYVVPKFTKIFIFIKYAVYLVSLGLLENEMNFDFVLILTVNSVIF